MDENNKLDAIIDIHKENSQILNFSPDELVKRLKKIQKDKIKADKRVKKAQNANFFDSIVTLFFVPKYSNEEFAPSASIKNSLGAFSLDKPILFIFPRFSVEIFFSKHLKEYGSGSNEI